MLGWYSDNAAGSYFAGHGACQDCVTDLREKAEGKPFPCPSCDRPVVRVDRNLQLEKFVEFVVEQRKKEKQENNGSSYSEEELVQAQKDLQEERKRNSEMEERMRLLEEEREGELEKMREDSLRITREQQEAIEAITAKKEELSMVLNQEGADRKAESEALQKRIQEMESDLLASNEARTALQAQYEQAEGEFQRIQTVRQINASPLRASGGELSGIGYLTDYLASFIWQKPPSALIEPLSHYTFQELRGKNRRTSRVRAAMYRNLRKVAAKLFTYSVGDVFPGSLLNTTLEMFQLTPEQRAENAVKVSEVRRKAIIALMREPMILYQMKNCAQINYLHKVVQPTKRGTFYIELPYVESDLEYVIEEKNSSVKQPLDQLIGYNERELIYQVLLAAEHMHSAGVVHRDLHPSIILLARNGIQVAGFSQAIAVETLRTCERNEDQYLPSDRRFTAPELLTGSHTIIPSSSWYSIDMWAIGCIMAYIYGRESLFSYNRPAPELETLPDLSQLQIDANGQDLLRLLLSNDPKARPTAKEAISQPYFDSVRNSSIRPERANPASCTDAAIPAFFDSLNL